jgi:hypothetical protein
MSDPMNRRPDPSKVIHLKEGQQYRHYRPKPIPRTRATPWVPIEKEDFYDKIECWQIEQRKQQNALN